jgi:hypothetical protein
MSEQELSLTTSEALEVLSDGHSVVLEQVAQCICTVFNVPLDEKLLIRWNSREDAWARFGFTARSDGPGTGARSLELSYYVAEKLGLGRPGAPFSGRGFQAQANGRAIAQFLSSKSEVSA